jgi:predicted dehydrogenase/threonine dehydrogenase-like Zn-dependent dehydrogenase
MLLEFGRAGWIDKARQQPDKVRLVMQTIRTDGLIATLESVQAKLGEPLPLGYCNVGTVIDAGSGAGGFAPGERVLSNGGHAEIVDVPVNLAASIPPTVGDEEAVFGVVGAIALQGIRLAQPSLGETFVVTGLGLIGLIAVQLLKCHGCKVIGLDLDAGRLAMARAWGAETIDVSASADPVREALALTRGRGVDGVIVAAATRSSEPITQAAQMCRKRGRVVLVGVTGLELSRADFYKKELSFQVSCSYGPGRYDPAYEEKGRDYPIGFVRWTAQRNFEAVLDMMALGRLDVRPLATHRFPFSEAEKAYELLLSGEPHLGIVIEYPGESERPTGELLRPTIHIARPVSRSAVVPGGGAVPRVNFVGAGGYAAKVLIPAFSGAGVTLGSVVSRGGVSAAHAARKFGFEAASTDVERALTDPDAGIVVIATRHDTHARFVCQALRAGRHVYVEKPLALTLEEIEEVERCYATAAPGLLLMVGFNRRFSPHVVKMKELLSGLNEPKSFIYTVNAGAIPVDHWTRDGDVGGGRLLGEACHFIDLLRHLAGCPIERVSTTRLAADTATIAVRFADGSIGSIHYFANGNRTLSKERLEVFCGGCVLQMDNFRRLKGYGWRRFNKMNLWRQDKGAGQAVRAFVNAVRSGAASPIAFDEICEVARATIAAAQ